jgi:hypothetical protein
VEWFDVLWLLLPLWAAVQIILGPKLDEFTAAGRQRLVDDPSVASRVLLRLLWPSRGRGWLLIGA